MIDTQASTVLLQQSDYKPESQMSKLLLALETRVSTLINNIRLWARDFYRVIVDEGAAQVDYQA